MSKHNEIALFTNDDTNPFSGEYTNTIWARKRVNGQFTVYVHCQGIDCGSVQDCWQKNIRTPEQFVRACKNCISFVDFGDIGITDIYHKFLPRLRELDADFADEVADHLHKEHGEEQFLETIPNVDPAEQEADGEVAEVECFTPLQSIRKYGASLIFVGSPRKASKTPSPSTPSASSTPPSDTKGKSQ